MIEKILPDAVACAEAFDDPPDAVLFPEEVAVISRAVQKRRREFRTVRHCARRAMRELGIPPAPVLSGERREPLWPPGVVGSLTHCTGYRAAALARTRDLLTIGIDAEPHEPLPPGVQGVVALDEEAARITELAATYRAQCWDRILFSAKEAVYKAWFPLTRSWLGFEDATVTIDPMTIDPGTSDPAHGTFAAHLLVPGPMIGGEALTGFDGHWLIDAGLVLTAIALTHQPRPT
ncbi:MAG: 4'-phosphopantetheinyl transferase family protein [Pseudonocardiaceae bacterium]